MVPRFLCEIVGVHPVADRKVGALIPRHLLADRGKRFVRLPGPGLENDEHGTSQDAAEQHHRQRLAEQAPLGGVVQVLKLDRVRLRGLADRELLSIPLRSGVSVDVRRAICQCFTPEPQRFFPLEVLGDDRALLQLCGRLFVHELDCSLLVLLVLKRNKDRHDVIGVEFRPARQLLQGSFGCVSLVDFVELAVHGHDLVEHLADPVGQLPRRLLFHDLLRVILEVILVNVHTQLGAGIARRNGPLIRLPAPYRGLAAASCLPSVPVLRARPCHLPAAAAGLPEP